MCLILCPSFLAAGVYLTVKHLVIHYGPEHSKLKPHLYTWIFISADIVSILTQAAGGGIAASETTNLVDIGTDIMVAGICIQVATMAVCGILAADFGLKVLRNRGNRGSGSESDGEPKRPPMLETENQFRFFLGAMSLSFLTIFIRSIYRIPEMVGGWGNPLMQDETEFLILDGT